MAKKIGVLVGSLRKESFNRKIANELIRLAPENLQLKIIEIAQLPMYNEDLEADLPKEWSDFRSEIQNSDAVLFISPEYNRTIPGCLKNAIDVGSRPPRENSWKRKPGAVITVTPGSLGGFGANHHIRQAVVAVDVRMMPQPEAYLSKISESFSEDGKTVNDRTEKFLLRFLDEFKKWIDCYKTSQSAPSS